MVINENLAVVIIIYHILKKGGKFFTVECSDINETTWSYQVRLKNKIVHCGTIKKRLPLEIPSLLDVANELMIYEQKLEAAKRAKALAGEEVSNG